MFGVGLGISIGRRRVASGSVPIDSDYQAVLNRATALGYTLPSSSVQTKQNQLLIDLKTAGVWAKLDVFYCFATDGDSNFATLNWKSPTTRQVTQVSSPTFITKQGFQGDGVAAHLNTNFNPSTAGVINYTTDVASRHFYLYAAGNSTNQSFEGTGSATTNNTLRASGLNQRINQGTSGINTAFDYTATKGMKSIHRTSNTNVELFNGTTQGSRTAAAIGLANSVQYVLRAGTTSNVSNHTVSMYSMGASLVSENTAYVTAFETYLNSI